MLVVKDLTTEKISKKKNSKIQANKKTAPERGSNK